jgi:hypothetical protein
MMKKKISLLILVGVFFYATNGFCFPRPPHLPVPVIPIPIPIPSVIPVPVPPEIEVEEVPPPPPIVQRRVVIDDSHLRAWREYHGGWINMPLGYAIELREIEAGVMQFHFIPEGERQWKKYRGNPPTAPPGFKNLTRILELGNGKGVKQFITISVDEETEDEGDE